MDFQRIIDDLRKENYCSKKRIHELELKLVIYQLGRNFRVKSQDYAKLLASSSDFKSSIALDTPLDLKAFVYNGIHRLYPDLIINDKIWQRIQVIFDSLMTLTSGAMRIQQNLLGVILYCTNTPDLVWRVLSRLGLAPSEKFVSKLLSVREESKSQNNCPLVFGIDTTYISTNFSMKSALVHPITICLANNTRIPWLPSDNLYKNFEEHQLIAQAIAKYKQVNDNQQWFLNVWEKLRNAKNISFPTDPLPKHAPFSYPKVHQFRFGLDSKKATNYGNVDDLIINICNKHKNPQVVFPTFFYADWEYYSKILTLSAKQSFLVPVLATWHYTWHLVKAIFILYGD